MYTLNISASLPLFPFQSCHASISFFAYIQLELDDLIRVFFWICSFVLILVRKILYEKCLFNVHTNIQQFFLLQHMPSYWFAWALAKQRHIKHKQLINTPRVISKNYYICLKCIWLTFWLEIDAVAKPSRKTIATETATAIATPSTTTTKTHSTQANEELYRTFVWWNRVCICVLLYIYELMYELYQLNEK